MSPLSALTAPSVTAPAFVLPFNDDPILDAIWKHRAAWLAFQIAADDEAHQACDLEDGALREIVSTNLTTLDGAHALIAHLRWFGAEEAEHRSDCCLYQQAAAFIVAADLLLAGRTRQ